MLVTRGVNLNKIFICTYDSMVMDLLRNEKDENEIDLIIDDIVKSSNMLVVSGTYIMGVVTAAYLKIQYDINCVTLCLK